MNHAKKTSRQVRIRIEAYRRLEKIAELTGKPKSLCASMIVEMFDGLLKELDEDDQLTIESKTKPKKSILLPLRKKVH